MARKDDDPKDLFSLLKQDHERIMNLFSQVLEKQKPASNLLSQIQDGLDMHMKGEEEFLYPALEQESDTQDLTLEAFEEHHVSKYVMTELSGMSDTDVHWMPKVKVLKELVDHHIQEEEDELFPKAKKVLSNDRIQGITKNIEKYIKG